MNHQQSRTQTAHKRLADLIFDHEATRGLTWDQRELMAPLHTSGGGAALAHFAFEVQPQAASRSKYSSPS